MLCPKCQSDTKVLNSVKHGKSYVGTRALVKCDIEQSMQRKRRCTNPKCRQTFTTIERMLESKDDYDKRLYIIIEGLKTVRDTITATLDATPK